MCSLYLIKTMQTKTVSTKRPSLPTLPQRESSSSLPALPNKDGLYKLKGELVEVRFWVCPDLVSSSFYYYSAAGKQLGYVETIVNTKRERVIFRVFNEDGDRVPRCEYESYSFLDAQ